MASCRRALVQGDVTGYKKVGSVEGELEAAVSQQPVAITVDAHAGGLFQHYKSGVLTNDACGDLANHAVLIVGYGQIKHWWGTKTKYWKIKNSWGSSWGESGYVRVEKGDPATNGECGVRENPYF